MRRCPETALVSVASRHTLCSQNIRDLLEIDDEASTTEERTATDRDRIQVATCMCEGVQSIASKKRGTGLVARTAVRATYIPYTVSVSPSSKLAAVRAIDFTRQHVTTSRSDHLPTDTLFTRDVDVLTIHHAAIKSQVGFRLATQSPFADTPLLPLKLQHFRVSTQTRINWLLKCESHKLVGCRCCGRSSCHVVQSV